MVLGGMEEQIPEEMAQPQVPASKSDSAPHPPPTPHSPTNSKSQTFTEGLLTGCFSLPIGAKLASTLSLF